MVSIKIKNNIELNKDTSIIIIICTSFGAIYSHDFVLYVFYVETYQSHKLLLLRINYFRTPVSTMVSGRDGPYHRPYLGDAMAMLINCKDTKK